MNNFFDLVTVKTNTPVVLLNNASNTTNSRHLNVFRLHKIQSCFFTHLLSSQAAL